MTANSLYLITTIVLLFLGIILTCLRGKRRSDFKKDVNQFIPWKAIFSYPAFMLVLGFLPATTIFLFWIARHNNKSWSYSFTYCFVVPTCIYGILYFVIGKPLPLGLVVQLLEI